MKNAKYAYKIFSCLIVLLLVMMTLPVEAEFQVNGDVVTDTETGLMWMQANDETTRTWEQALAYCQSLDHGGYSDWRLPDSNELVSLVDYSTYSPSIDTTAFTCNSSEYWASTPSVVYDSIARSVSFDTGIVVNTGMSSTYYARCVRGGP